MRYLLYNNKLFGIFSFVETMYIFYFLIVVKDQIVDFFLIIVRA